MKGEGVGSVTDGVEVGEVGVVAWRGGVSTVSQCFGAGNEDG